MDFLIILLLVSTPCLLFFAGVFACTGFNYCIVYGYGKSFSSVADKQQMNFQQEKEFEIVKPLIPMELSNIRLSPITRIDLKTFSFDVYAKGNLELNLDNRF